MLPCHNLRYLEEQRGGVFLNLLREGEKPQTRKTFMGRHKKLPRELTTELLYLELSTYFSLFWCKKIYAEHNIPFN